MMDTFHRIIARQHWIRRGIRSRWLEIFRDPDKIRSMEFETGFFGAKYRGNLDSYIDWNVFFYGAYEREFLLFLRNLVKDKSDPVFLDIGANVGQHSLFMSLVCDEVHSFEPNPAVRKRLEDQIRINDTTNIIVHDVGLGVQDDELPFFAPKGWNQGTGSFVKEHSDYNEEEPIFLRVVNGDRYVSRLALTKVDLIKIDVEGFEKYVLDGLKETLDRHRPLIAIEHSADPQGYFLGAEELTKLLPPSYMVEKISCNRPYAQVFNSPCCILEEYDFGEPGGNLLLYPSEIGHWLTNVKG